MVVFVVGTLLAIGISGVSFVTSEKIERRIIDMCAEEKTRKLCERRLRQFARQLVSEPPVRKAVRGPRGKPGPRGRDAPRIPSAPLRTREIVRERMVRLRPITIIRRVTIIRRGPRGPRGPQGPAGPQGPPGHLDPPPVPLPPAVCQTAPLLCR